MAFKRLKKDWGEQTEALCQSLKQAAPLTLRVNQRHIGRDAYLAKLQSLDIQARACTLSDAVLFLNNLYKSHSYRVLNRAGFLYKMNMHSYVQPYCLI